jgi:ureidoacrylate peracid hydrolase
VRDAMMLDFETYMPHDAVVAPYYDGHLAAMRSVVQIFADVRPVDELIELMSART